MTLRISLILLHQYESILFKLSILMLNVIRVQRKISFKNNFEVLILCLSLFLFGASLFMCHNTKAKKLKSQIFLSGVNGEQNRAKRRVNTLTWDTNLTSKKLDV